MSVEHSYIHALCRVSRWGSAGSWETWRGAPLLLHGLLRKVRGGGGGLAWKQGLLFGLVAVPPGPPAELLVSSVRLLVCSGGYVTEAYRGQHTHPCCAWEPLPLRLGAGVAACVAALESGVVGTGGGH